MIFTREFSMRLPITLSQAWEFLSDPKNLARITPPFMGFHITSNVPEKMYVGLIISYKISPIAGINIPWVTEIIHVDEPNYFIDEQRFGPYRFWHHQHHLKEIEGGVLMTDILNYALWFPPFDRIINYFVVQKRITEIFNYREQALAQLLGSWDKL